MALIVVGGVYSKYFSSVETNLFCSSVSDSWFESMLSSYKKGLLKTFLVRASISDFFFCLYLFVCCKLFGKDICSDNLSKSFFTSSAVIVFLDLFKFIINSIIALYCAVHLTDSSDIHVDNNLIFGSCKIV